jgi:hypothetical protein
MMSQQQPVELERAQAEAPPFSPDVALQVEFERQTLKPVFSLDRLQLMGLKGYRLWVNLIQRAAPHRARAHARPRAIPRDVRPTDASSWPTDARIPTVPARGGRARRVAIGASCI